MPRRPTSSLNECQPGSQAGLVTIVANYEGNPNTSSARRRSTTWRRSTKTKRRAWRSSPRRSTSRSVIPITVRSGSDYGLQMTVASISQTVALSVRSTSRSGASRRDPEHDAERFHPGAPGRTARAARAPRRDCIAAPLPAGRRDCPALHRQPERLHRRPAAGDASTSTTYQDPNPTTQLVSTYPATTGCENQKFDPVFNLGLTTTEADAPSGLDIQLKADQFLDGEAPTRRRPCARRR